MLGLNKEQWAEIHTNLGILFLATLNFHIYFNWKAIKIYLNNKANNFKFFSTEFNSAALIVTAFFLGTYFQLMPFSSILQLSADIKQNAASQYGDPPFGGAQRSSLVEFAERLQLDLSQGVIQLKNSGFEIEDTSMTLEELADINHTTPQQIYLTMMPEQTQADAAARKPSTALVTPVPTTSGLGRMTLAELNKHYGINLEQALAQLQARNNSINKDTKIRDIAELFGQTPEEVFNQLTMSNQSK